VSEYDTDLAKISDEAIKVPGELMEALTPITYIVPLQLLAYHTALRRGINPDLLRTNINKYDNAWFKYFFPPGTH